MVLTPRDVREGISKKNGQPYAIATQKAFAGTQTYKILVVRQLASDFPPPLPVGENVRIRVESADKQDRGSDIEIIGEVID